MLTTTLVGHACERSLHDALRLVLDRAEEAVLCFAVVRRAGVHLVEAELTSLAERGRVVTTPMARGGSTRTAIDALHEANLKVRIIEPTRGRFQARTAIARRGPTTRALIGSAELSAGLLTDIQTAVLLEGDADEPVLRDIWSTAAAQWSMDGTQPWEPRPVEAGDEVFPDPLYDALVRQVAREPVFLSLGHKRPYRVTELRRNGLWIETDALLLRHLPSQFVPAWMLTLAWDVLRVQGSLTRSYLRDNDGLNLTRASEILAFLARLPAVRVASTRPVTLTMPPDPFGLLRS